MRICIIVLEANDKTDIDQAIADLKSNFDYDKTQCDMTVIYDIEVTK